MPVTIRWNGDTAHDNLVLSAVLPEGVGLWGVEGTPALCFGSSCDLGGRYTQGEEHTHQAKLLAPAETVPGDLGAGSLELRIRYLGEDIAGVSPPTTPPRSR